MNDANGITNLTFYSSLIFPNATQPFILATYKTNQSLIKLNKK